MKEAKYPNKCVRCGFCCLAETCPTGMDVYGIDKHTKCPALRFERNNTATCLLVHAKLVPIGDGCCIKARAFKDGQVYDFAGLPRKLKKNVVQSVREGGYRRERENERQHPDPLPGQGNNGLQVGM